MTVQLSVLKIIGYGPWTLTLGSDREHELQMLQASLYAEVQRLFSERNCLVFSNRADEMFVLSTGLDLADHAAIQDVLASKFENVSLRIAIGRGTTPADADRAAREAVSGRAEIAEGQEGQNDSNILDARRHIFGAGHNCNQTAQDTIVMHMDVDGLGARRASPYETSLLMLKLHRSMSLYFYEECDSLAFFMGGDNFMIISSEKAKGAARGFIDMIKRQDGIQLNCGIGSAKTGRDAARLATESLDMIRKMRDTAVGMDGDDSGDADSGHSSHNSTPDTDNTTETWPRVYEHATGQSF